MSNDQLCPHCKTPYIKRIRVGRDYGQEHIENQLAYLHEQFHESRSYCVKPKKNK